MDWNTTEVVTTDNICDELRKRHRFIDDNIVRKAYALLIRRLKSENRIDEIDRYLKVALRVARMDFGIDVVIAVLVSEVNEKAETIRDSFGVTAMRVAREYQDICHFSVPPEQWLRRYFRRDSRNVSLCLAFLILSLVTGERFYEIPIRKDDEREAMADLIRQYLMPVAVHEKMYGCLDWLEDICLDAGERRAHRLIKKYYDEFIESNDYSAGVAEKLEEALMVIKPGYFRRVLFERMLPKEIYDSFRLRCSNIETELKGFFDKTWFRMGDIYMITQDDDPEKPAAVFLNCYERELSKQGFSVIGVRRAERTGLRYFLLKDRMRSVFRVYPLSEYAYAKAKFGVMIDYGASTGSRVSELAEATPTGIIRVFDYCNNPWEVNAEITVLDFAFISGENTGVCFCAAEVSGAAVPPDYILKSGDCVKIMTSETPQAKLEWFNAVRTALARDILIQYFKSIF